MNLGMHYYNAREAHRAIELLAILTGNKVALAVQGKSGWPTRLNDGPIMCPDGIENTKGDRPTVTEFLDNFKNSESKYKALLTTKRQQYPLHLFVARHRVFMQTQFTEFPELRAIAGKEPWMRLNPDDAAQRDIKDGDMVMVFNDRGKLRIKGHLSAFEIVPDVITYNYCDKRKDDIE